MFEPFSPDGKLLTTIENKAPRNWDSATGKSLGKPLPLSSGVGDIAVSPDRKRAVIVRSGNAEVWSMTSGKILHKLPIGSLDEIGRASAAFSPDGKRIVTVVNWSVQLWDAETGKRVGIEHACASSDAEGGAEVTFSPDSTCFLISCSDSRDDKLVSCLELRNQRAIQCFFIEARASHFAASGGSVRCSVHGRWDAHCHDLPGSCRAGVGLRKGNAQLGSLCVMRIAPKTESKAPH